MNIKINSTLVNNHANQKAGVVNKAERKSADVASTIGTQKQDGLDEGIKLSQKARDISQTSQSVNKVKVAELKQAILDGSYKVDAKEVAKNMFNFEKLFGI